MQLSLVVAWEFDVIQGIAIDANDNIYVADYANERIQVFDTRGNFRREMRGFGAPMAICITPGPNQVMYVSKSGHVRVELQPSRQPGCRRRDL